jgi:allophanate hydrolase
MFRPVDVITAILDRIAKRGDDKIWIHLLPEAELIDRARELERQSPEALPLFGIPFAIKDNIDLAPHPTTAACPQFAYSAKASAAVVQKLVDAGAIAIGKTNLDQFATGLVGTRSPYGACGNAFNADYISGGSSSGSAIAVATGLVSFALGTDTAGSGRVPAAFNNIVGLKPTRGLLSTRGVVPACRSLDCVSIFALTTEDARDVLAIARGYDPADPFSREVRAIRTDGFDGEHPNFRFGVPGSEQLEFFGNHDAKRLFSCFVEQLDLWGGVRVEIDFQPFLETARLLYQGPWVAERYVAIREFIEQKPQALHPVTRQIIQGGKELKAADAFAAYYRLKELRRKTAPTWDQIDVLLTPTAGTVYTIAAVAADPIRLNSDLGYYTNFVNLLDLSALALPAGFQRNGLPFGVTLAAPAFRDDALCELGDVLQRKLGLKLGATRHEIPARTNPAAMLSRAHEQKGKTVRVAVCGAHMSGLPLNHQLTERSGRLVRACRTAPSYRLFALEGFAPIRPGLVRAAPGHAIELEVWEMPVEQFGGFVDGIPPPLGIGTVELEDGEPVRGFLCESYASAHAKDISELGSWRAYLVTPR